MIRLNPKNLRSITLISAVALLSISIKPLFAQDELCVGRYFTPEEGHAVLQKVTPATLVEWEKRRMAVLDQIKKGMELEKVPPRPNSPIIRHSRRKMQGYVVENIAFEVLPGVYVTGNLYQPEKKSKSMPAVLAPHGHGRNPDGRFMEQTQIRAAMLARGGAVVFTYDMLGHGDSQHSDHKLPKALKLQTISSIRALDFLLEQPGVDPARLAVSGESGGGTQTFLLAALDDRVKVTVPCVMISAYFFGGCVCESGMPIHKKGSYQTTNAEIAALTAPRPMLMISNGKDWTQHNPVSEYPYMQKVYNLYGQKENVQNVHLPEEGHDFGPSKRKAMYEFLSQHIGIDLKKLKNRKGDFDESLATVLPEADLRVFNDQHPRPANYLTGEERLSALLDSF